MKLIVEVAKGFRVGGNAFRIYFLQNGMAYKI